MSIVDNPKSKHWVDVHSESESRLHLYTTDQNGIEFTCNNLFVTIWVSGSTRTKELLNKPLSRSRV